LTTSMPASRCLATISGTARSRRLSSSAWSAGRSCSMPAQMTSTTSSGRGRLPAWVVMMRSVLRGMAATVYDRAAERQSPLHSGFQRMLTAVPGPPGLTLATAGCECRSTTHEEREGGPVAVAVQTMTDEQRKSVALEYLKAFDNGGVTSTGGSILDLFAEDAQVYFPKWGVATGKAQIGKMFGDVGSQVKSIRHHYANFNWIFSGSDLVVCEGTSHGEHKD